MSLIRKQLEKDRAEVQPRPDLVGTLARPRPNAERDMLAGFESVKLNNELILTKKVVDLLAERFDVENLLYVIYMIKKKIKAGKVREITAAKIRQWDKASL